MDIAHNIRFKWNGHVPHLSQIFNTLRYDEVYCDTTLITEDGYVIKAHGAVLIATSRYFEHVLCNVTPDQHPIIVLKGVNFPELSCLLDYIYQGVTEVDQHMMESVLDAADMLEIKGLSKMKNNLSIKKLIAPSPSSMVTSRNSPQCSSPSKSPPSPPSPHAHSPSCPSPSSDVYTQSVTLKPDTEDKNESLDNGQKSRHVFSDNKTSVSTREVDSSEYVASTSKHSLFASSEYLDQTLGIDLSLSRVSYEENGKTYGKNFSVYEDTPLRKRKIMKTTEDAGASLSELDCSRFEEEKVDDTMVHRKKKVFSRAVSLVKSYPSCSQEETHNSNSHLTLENLASLLSKDKSESPTLLKQKSIMNSDDGSHSALDSHVEVLCSDGALTISVTTDSIHQSPLKSLNGAQLSLSFKKAKRKRWNKREMISVKRESVDERKSSVLLKRPNNKSFKRLRSHAMQTDLYSSESLSVHCDPPFPTDDSLKHHSSAKDKLVTFSSSNEDDKLDKEREIPSTEDDEIVSNNSPRQSSKDNEERKARKLSCISPLTLFTLPPAKEKEKQTRTSLTLEEKIKVIQAFLDGKSQRQIANLHGIGKTQVNGIVKKREEILSLYRESVVRGEKLTMKRQRKSEYASLNDHLIKWYRHMTVVAGMKITTGMLRAKALQIAPQLGYHDFKASNGWLATFKTNNNLKFSRVKKPSDSFSIESYDDGETQKEGELFEEEIEEDPNINNVNNSQSSVVASSAEGIATYSVGLHLGSMRGDNDSEIVTTCQPPPPPVSNLAIGNSLLASSGPLPKPPQMSNMALGTNIAYNLTREHTRTDLTHLSDLHTASSVNAPPSLAHPSHPPLPKPPEGPLSYKTEDALSYGYETQGRMNEGTSRGTEYNYTHYGFPSTYYGYHFLGQY